MDRQIIIVCDDDKAARSIIANAVQGGFAELGVEVETVLCASGAELRTRLSNGCFDLLFLDIDMPGISGIQLGRQLRNEGREIDIIYVSNREDRVFDSLKVDPVGFIRKSHLIEDIPDVLRRYWKRCESRQTEKMLIVETKERILSIPLKDVVYIEAARNCQMLHIRGRAKPCQIRRNLKDLEDELAQDGFIRIHKGYLVNYHYIRLIEQDSVLLTDGEQVPLSRRKLQAVKSRFLQLMQKNGAVLS